ncbi:MAG: DUF1565 domain-containing protein [bacterium]
MRRRNGLVTLLLLLFGGCGDADQNGSECPEGFERRGSACVPIFDDCPGPSEIPVLGGGCRAVGVTACATGLFEPDGEGGCEPILPPGPEPCPPGTMEVLGQTECQPVGVTECAAGFEPDGAGGCDAILPPGPDPCPSGTIALLGHDTCQPLGDCGSGGGSGPWGNIVDDGATVYVDQTADATGADGTQQAPFVTIVEALTAVAPGGQIAVAAGDYTERLNIGKEVRLTGRCAELVTIRGQVWLGEPQPPVNITAGGTGTTVRGVTLTGPGAGLVVWAAQQVFLSELQVLAAGEVGIVAQGEAEVSLLRVVVADCAKAGVFSDGSMLTLEESVVRDTQSQAGTGWFGRGIHAECYLAEACGSLHVSSSLVSDNRELGIGAIGVYAEVTASVVRDTLPEESMGELGWGISAACSNSGACGSLRVSSSLISGNREVGISAGGVDAEVTLSVVRDTVPEEGTGEIGRGIEVWCTTEGTCGRLLVSSSVVSGNRDMGILAIGVDTEVTTSVVRDTLSELGSGRFGVGIAIRCPAVGACGSLLVSSSLVSGNRDVGILIGGPTAEVTASVVRDTEAEESTGMYGWGISSQCHPESGSCEPLRVSACVLSGNRGMGISVAGVDTEIIDTLVRDTLPEVSTGELGRGINARCHPEVGVCGSLRLSSSVFSGNREVGVAAFGMDTEVTATVVRDTLPEESTLTSGRGINVQCDLQGGACGSLRVSESLVMGSENVGIFITGVPTTLEGVAVIDTRPNALGFWRGIDGQGIWSLCDAETGDCGDFSMTSSLVESSQGAGVALEGISGFMASSVVRAVTAQVLDDRYGYGVQIGGLEGQQGPEMPTFDVNDCAIRDATLAGIFYFRARGTLAGSMVSGGENSVIMNEGSEVTILDTNELLGTVKSEPSWANLFPAPAPPPALPLDPMQ